MADGEPRTEFRQHSPRLKKQADGKMRPPISLLLRAALLVRTALHLNARNCFLAADIIVANANVAAGL